MTTATVHGHPIHPILVAIPLGVWTSRVTTGRLPPSSSLSWELPLPAHFEAVAELVTEDQVAESVTCGPDPAKHLAAIRTYVEAGYDHVCVHQVGKEQKGFFAFYERDILPHLGSIHGSRRRASRRSRSRRR